MSSIVARAAFRAAPRFSAPAARRRVTTASKAEQQAGKEALKTGAKRDPELYVGRPSEGTHSVHASTRRLIGL